MGKRVYRMCLFVILMIVAAGGVYYYMTVYQKEEKVDKGTFVYSADQTVQMADHRMSEPLFDLLRDESVSDFWGC